MLPQAQDALHPHFHFSNAYVDLLVADVVKEVGAVLADKALSKSALELSKKMAVSAGTALTSAWEPGDDICPPWRGPGPRPNWWTTVVDPEPSPWHMLNSAAQVELAHLLVHASGLTSSAEYNTSLKSLATSVARGAASALADDFERCGTKPRPPLPNPHR